MPQGVVPFLRMNASPSADDAPSPSRWRDIALFFRNWLRTPSTTGALVPSSRAMAQSMVAPLQGFDTPTVAELGAGTGAVTGVIQNRLRGRSHHLAIEVSESLCERLRTLYPNVDVVNESAAALSRLLRERNLDHVDAVISGLPFTTFTHQLQSEILDSIVESLPDHGVFATFRYLGAGSFPSARRFREQLDARFGSVELSPIILKNFPPVYILTARQPRTGAD